ncbi:diguanylate cyclase/phosphodiesterase with PAS/PAC sensor(s) [Candidatus Magnetomorum sp. HK-1]|nr:diguanylate cyclase/phosphodiesterase with PAS/PAC sensor(s) [Candidatus Magnetomorum sp. HK-1]
MKNDISSSIDILWIVFSGSLVFLMQPGFMCLESGMTRSKNSINVAIKNLADFVFAVLLFWALGFGVMFGQTISGILGTKLFFFSFDNDAFLSAFFFFQAMFCGTATTIFSGAVAERMRFVSYLMIAIFLSTIIYPLFGHWAWNGLNHGKSLGWLARMGFIDFAGSTVVHSIGGWVALAALILIGPREGRFSKNNKAIEITAWNIPLSVLGTLLLWFGWFGFNAGSTLAFNFEVPSIIVKTILAGASGAVVYLLTGWYFTGIPGINFLINGSIGGLVAITASCNSVSAIGAVCIGTISAWVCMSTERLLVRFNIDDAVGAVPVHLGCGIWGTLAVAIWGDPQILATGLSFMEQLCAQLLGIFTAFALSFPLSLIFLRLIDQKFHLRVSKSEELIGLNVSEHGAKTETSELFSIMKKQAKTGDLSLRVPVDPFTEIGHIAKGYNQVIDALQHQRAYFKQLFKNSPQAIVIIDQDGKIISINKGYENMFGYSQDEVRSKLNRELIVPEDRIDEIKTINQTVLNGKSIHKETYRKHKDGRVIPVLMLGYPINIDDNIDGVFYIYNDISERKAFEEQLYQQAFYDSLTELPNRALFMERLNHAIERRKRRKHYKYALIMFDLDRFKRVNDSLGHPVGDELLVQMAARFKKCIRSVDTVARLGGDEFAILLEEFYDVKDVIRVARRIRNEAREPVLIENNEIYVGASIGIVLNVNSYSNTEDILRDADIAMYRAKESGKGCFKVFNKKMHAEAIESIVIENDLRNAISGNELTLYYQPILKTGTEEMEGFEALVRWIHPSQGIIPPGKFIPQAEETGLIIPLGRWVISEACRQLKIWRETIPQSHDLTVSVNVSSKQFMQKDFVDFISSTLQKYSCDADQLKIELTESVLMDYAETSIEKLNDLKKMGIKLIIDDFGTGYSSLSYLNRFPIDGLKIDRSFISNMNASTEDMEIVKTVLTLAQHLGLKVVAEGVEEKNQLSVLKELSCESVQGFYFAKPLEEKYATAMINQKKDSG